MSTKENFSEAEIELIKGCLDGDRKSQRDLYDQFSSKFLSICLRYIKDQDLAQDVLVEGFMKIFQSLNTFRNEGSFEGWMKRIMVRQALQTLRKNKKLLMEVDWDDNDHISTPNLVFGNIEADELLKLVASLPVGYRTVFNLYAIEGYSHKEISELLGIAENTSKSQLSRARSLLQKQIAPNSIKVNSNGR
ncbi:RNA polymerase sigma factor [Cyclobacterium amurskyense]|jgi:RNA polymerase sigma-70 factor (ECF subfamily)|uniref:RNA polymerase, sigma-24 subunit, ECF subfamily n=1 Tax=Cyclobacterium amurskyense TaxID=320787 RepID=A0A0H4PBD8_9BACT|nr:RNA polymerase sigma factor [Cyclobacterium amurskyense]AKP50093.1 RNA polymerase, sigma-24 subunit, ECF subfamily [Cyclobacterium amurskyense]|tara:strand:- start:7316 stop:7888 length:573 start_codon:yes stop_codon:yes gene_type:complete